MFIPNNVRNLLLLVASASAALLAAALIGQYGFNLHPCDLCIKQRYPYMAIIVLGVAGVLFIKSARIRYCIAVMCLLLFLLDAGIAYYHAGVEAGIFKGPDACASSSGAGQTLEEMRAAIMNAPLVSCSQAMIHILGLSLAAWNALAATLLAIVTFIALLKIKRSA